MGRSVASAARVTEGQSVTTPYLDGLVGATPKGKQVSAGKSLTGLDLCALLGDAIDATGSRKEAAADMGISQPVLTKQIARTDDAAPRLDRISQLKVETVREFGERIVAACGSVDPSVLRRQAAEDAMRAIGRLLAVGE